jgi:hypothetical protein
VVIVVAAWMLDPAACAGMGLGVPRAAASALVDLHQLLIERGFRRSCLDEPSIVQEERDEKPVDTRTTTRGPAPIDVPSRPTVARSSPRIREEGESYISLYINILIGHAHKDMRGPCYGSTVAR